MRVSVLSLGLALCAAFLSMGLYALLGARRDRDASAKGSQLALGVGNFLVHWFMWLLGPADRWALASGVSPQVFNYAGLMLGAVSGVAIALDHLLIGGCAVLLGGVCDILDGRVARGHGLTSDFGKFIDSTLDRFVEVFVFLGFVVYLRNEAAGPLVAAAAMAGSLLVSYARARGESTGLDFKGGLMQRAERLVLICLVCFGETPVQHGLGWPAGRLALCLIGVIALGTLFTAAYRTIWIATHLRRREGQGSQGR
jgi:CDP-diacylglycerol--glycerol-3-phosphate 3-phosphatidyltransferase